MFLCRNLSVILKTKKKQKKNSEYIIQNQQQLSNTPEVSAPGEPTVILALRFGRLQKRVWQPRLYVRQV